MTRYNGKRAAVKREKVNMERDVEISGKEL